MVGSTLPAPAAAPSFQDGLDRRRLDVVLGFATSLRWPVIVTLCVIASLLWQDIPKPVVIGWLTLAVAARELRAMRLQSLAARPGTPLQTMIRAAVLWDIPIGLAHGSSAIFMRWLNPTYDAVLTMILCSLASGAVSTSATFLRMYVIYACCIFIPLSAMWLWTMEPLGIAIGTLILLFGAVQFRFAKQNSDVFEESYRMRVENEELMRELAAARDVAEAANRAKSRFLAVASHDLRQPLHAMSLYSGLLSQDPLPDNAAAIAAEMSSSTDSLAALLDSLLDISKLDAGVVTVERRPIQLQRLIAHLVRTHLAQAQEKGLALHFDCPAEVVVDTDPLLLERLLRNLIDNAIKYTERGEIRVAVTAVDQRLDVSVHDSGRGIPADAQERVFEEFFQVDTGGHDRDRTQGLGLGLAIVSRMAKLLDLTVRLRSEPGTGTTVSFTMDRVATVAEESPLSAVSAGELRGVKVLFIDDEAPVRRAMANVLRRFGCEAAEAASTDEALDCIKGFAPQLVVADYRLRNGDSGVAAITRLREHFPDLPALLISGDTDAERLQEAERTEIPLLHKPLSLERLRQAMCSVLGVALDPVSERRNDHDLASR